jgi:hypothetical protein
MQAPTLTSPPPAAAPEPPRPEPASEAPASESPLPAPPPPRGTVPAVAPGRTASAPFPLPCPIHRGAFRHPLDRLGRRPRPCLRRGAARAVLGPSAAMFGPGVRIAGGFALAFGLIGLGEFLRRRLRGGGADCPRSGPTCRPWSPPPAPSACSERSTPRTRLYGFIGPGLAFAGLAVTGLAAMAAALLARAGAGRDRPRRGAGHPAPRRRRGDRACGRSPSTCRGGGSAYAFAWLKGWRALAVSAAIGARGLGPVLTILPGEGAAVHAHLVLQQALAVLVFARAAGARRAR